MNRFDFSVPAVLHLGNGSKKAMVALGVALATAFVAVQVLQPFTPVVHVAGQQTQAEIQAQALRSAAFWENTNNEQRTALEAQKIKETRRNFAVAAELIARRHGTGTCFGGFLDGEARQSDIERSTVMLVAKDSRSDDISTGSGFIVRDSAGADGHNRIVTAGHVVNPVDLDTVESYVDAIKDLASQRYDDLNTQEAVKRYIGVNLGAKGNLDSLARDIVIPFGQLSAAQRRDIQANLNLANFDHIDAYASDGTFLGRMKTVAMGQPEGSKTEVGTLKGISDANDWAVLSLDTRNTPRQAVERFDAITGLAIAPVQAAHKSWGMSGDGLRPAATHGYSGGPVVDDDGLVHGIVSSATPLRDTVEKVNGMLQPTGIDRQGKDNVRGSVALPVKSVLYVNPVGNPRLLDALGGAGISVTVGDNASLHSGSTTMTIVGMPQGYCSASATIQVPFGSPLLDPSSVSYNEEIVAYEVSASLTR